jgi:SSS family solute:Na+ symporter
MHLIDWVIVALYFIISLAIGIIYSKKAGGSTENFFSPEESFHGGLQVFQWLQLLLQQILPCCYRTCRTKRYCRKLAMVEYAHRGMLTVFFFSRLWRRANILTDVEFIELRYSGKSAAVLRGFKGIYMGIFMNTIIMGWVNLAMIKY